MTDDRDGSAIRADPRGRPWGQVAAGWCVVFAAVHLYWALGGTIGLAESAGADLADQRPTWFVAAGLYGVAVLLLAAAALGVVLGRGEVTGPRGRVLWLLANGVAVVLLARALGVEAVLLADPGYGDGAVTPSQRFWTLVLWNPWFLLGGALFALTARGARRSRRLS